MEDNPLNGLKKSADVSIGIFIALFFLVNILVLIWGSPSGFQRLGSLWVAVLLFAFGFLKLTLSEINKAVSGRGEFAGWVKEKLDPFVYSEDKGWLNYGSEDGVEYENPLHTQDEVRSFLREIEDRILFAFLPNELLFGAFATLQWGYGDLLYCFLHGKGWTTC